MFRSSSNRSSVKASFRPGMEGLEERSLMACAVFVGPAGTLNVVGNGAADTVQFFDNGAGFVAGSATGFGAFGFAGITQIRCSTGGGNDSVDYTLTANLAAGQTQTLKADLGGGNDRFLATLNGDLLAMSRLTLGVAGSDGRDEIMIGANNDVDVAPTARLQAILDGGAGDDFLGMLYHGTNHGLVALRKCDAGAGKDVVRAELREDVGSFGKLYGDVFGNTGNDTLSLFMLTANVPIHAKLDGGLGIDVGNATANVTVVNVP